MQARTMRSEAAANQAMHSAAQATAPAIGATFHKPAPVRTARRAPAGHAARILAAVLMACTLAACGGGDPDPAADNAPDAIPATPARVAAK